MPYIKGGTKKNLNNKRNQNICGFVCGYSYGEGNKGRGGFIHQTMKE